MARLVAALGGCSRHTREEEGRARKLENLSCSKVPIRCITPPFYKGRQEWKLVLHKHTWLSHVAKWKETSPKWLHGWMGGHEWPRERWRARWHSAKERKKRLDGPLGPF